MLWICIILVLNALLPTKWLRVAGIPLGDCMTTIIYAVYTFRALVAHRRVARRHLPWILCLVVVFVSAVAAALAHRDPEALLITLRQVYHYLFLFPLYCEVKTLKQYSLVLKIYLGVSLLASVALHVYHALPQLANPELGDASFRGWIGRDARIFTPGMGYALFAAVCMMVLLTDTRLKTVALGITAQLVLLSGLVWTFTRSFFVVVAVCLVLEITFTMFSRWRLRSFVVLVTSLILVAGVASVYANELSALIDRLGTVGGAVADFERNSDTVAWRVLEANVAIDSMSGPFQFALGMFAGRFGLREYVGYSPHIGWVGLLYHFGAVGVVAFTALFVVLMRRLGRQFLRHRSSSNTFLRFAVNAHVLGFIAFALVTFGGGSFATSGTIISLALLWHGTAIIEGLPATSAVMWVLRPPHGAGARREASSTTAAPPRFARR